MEDLLAHKDFVRGLARRLVRDEARADDLVQETWLAAVRSPPAPGGMVRAWLARVVRNAAKNLGRSESRRSAREERAGRPAPPPSPEEVVEREATRRRVVRAVLALEPPYRDAILLRYYEDLPPRRVAARLGVPVETARTRIRRARERLKERLDETAGDRRAWLLPLLPFAGRPPLLAGIGAALPGGIVMSGKKIAAAVVILVVLGASAVYLGWDRPDDPPNAPTTPGPDDPGPVTVVRGGASSSEEESGASGGEEPGTETVSGSEIFAFAGRVTDDRRRPVEGAEVTLLFPGMAPIRGTTDEAGEYRLESADKSDVALRGGVLARDGKGRSGVGHVMLAPHPPAVWQVEPIALSAGHALAVQARQNGDHVPGATVDAWVTEEGGGVPRVYAGSRRTDADGTARFEALPAGRVFLAARDGGANLGSATTRLPRVSGAPVVIDLREVRTVEVTVIDDTTGEPIAGAALEVWEKPEEKWTPWIPHLPPAHADATGADGTTRITGLGNGGDLLVRPRVPGRPASHLPRPEEGATPLEPGVSALTIRIPGGRIVRWAVVAGDAPVPESGTALDCAPLGARYTASPRLRIDGSEIVAHGVPSGPIRFLAVAADRSAALLMAPSGAERGPETTFRRPRAVDVLVREEDGDGVPGVFLLVRDTAGDAMTPPVVTGEDGRVSIPVHAEGTVEIGVLAHPALRSFRTPAGSVDLAEGDAQLTITLGAKVEILLRVTVDGVPALPAGCSVRVAGIPARDKEEDPDRGEIRVRVRPDRPGAPLFLQFVTSKLGSRTFTVPTGDGRSTHTLDVALGGGGALLVRHDGGLERSGDIVLQTSAGGRGWAPISPLACRGVVAEEGNAVLFRPLDPGRYRVRDGVTGVTGPEVDVRAGEEAAEVSLRLPPVVTLTGRVEAPAGTDLTRTWVAVVPKPRTGLPVASMIAPDGSFSLRVPADREVALAAVDQNVTELGPRVVATGPREGLVVRVAPVTVVTLTPSSAGWERADVRALLMKDGRVVGYVGPEFVDGMIRLAIPGTGPVRVLLDVQGHAPKLLPEFRREGKPIGLGVVTLDRGGRVRIRFPATAGGERVQILARSIGEPLYHRRLTTEPTGEVVLQGFGPGRFQVLIGKTGANASPVSREVEIPEDGEALIDLTDR